MRRYLMTVAIVASAGSACAREYETLETGTVALSWYVGPHGCADAEADRIEASLVGAPDRSWEFACDARAGVVSGLSAGRYAFDLRAVTTNGRATFVGQTAEVDVRPGGVSEPPPVVMEATPASLTVEWNFGGPLCRQAGATTVEVMAFDPWGTIESQAVTMCELGAATVSVRPGVYDVVVHAVSNQGYPTHESMFTLELDRGDERYERVVLGAIVGASTEVP